MWLRLWHSCGVRDPRELFVEHARAETITSPVLVYAFTGFVDAGNGVRLASEHLLRSCEHRLLATFDADELLDFRARRPRMSYVVDHFVSVDIPQITLHEVVDDDGRAFLFLQGPEPDYQWLRFMSAVDLVVEEYSVSLAVGLTSMPWPTPHTRPLGLTVHGSEPALVAGQTSIIGEIEVPGHVSAMLELHLGQTGVPSMGLTAQVPHYLVQFDYPRAAETLLLGLGTYAGLRISTTELGPAADEADREVAQQIENNPEFATVVTALEQQYDQVGAAREIVAGGLADLADENFPNGEEIAAQVEEFLAGLVDPDDPGKQTG